MLAHLSGENTKSDTRKVIDREVRAFWVIHREYANTQYLDLGVLKPFFKKQADPRAP